MACILLQMKRLVLVLSILGVVLLAWTLRMRAVEQLPIDYDEDDYLRAAQEMATAVQAGDWSAIPNLNYRPEHPPLAKLAYGLAISPLPPAKEIPDRPTTAQPAPSLPQPHLETARRVGAFFGTLEVLLLALLNPLAGFFLAIHSWTIKYNSQVMLEALPAFTSAVAVVAYDRSRIYKTGHGWGWVLLSAFFLGLTAAAKYLYALVGIAILLHWFWMTFRDEEKRNGRFLLHWLGQTFLWGITALIIFFLANPYLWPDPIARLLDSILYHGGYSQSAAVQNTGWPMWQPLVWLLGSVPWHPGVFVFLLDLFIAALALVGLKPLWQKRPLYAFWLFTVFTFLLIWPTKWPQYVLTLTFPLSLAAALGFTAVIWHPLQKWWENTRQNGLSVPNAKTRQQQKQGLRKAWLWLLPGLIIMCLITYYPLLYQTGMAMTDISSFSLRDGLEGGIGREVTAGLTGQVDPVNVSFFQRPNNREVNFAGISLIAQLFVGTGSFLAFELIWTVLVVLLQLILGVCTALLLNQKFVRFKGVWFALFILPWAIPEFVGALSWLHIFDPGSGSVALYSQSAPPEALSRTLASWQESPQLTLLVLLLIGTWMGFPLMMLAATAGLKLIPHEALDAALVDGASRWQRFRWIMWPMLLPLLIPIIIIRAIFAFNQFYLFLVLQPQGNLTTFATLSYYFADASFFGGWYGASAAINLFTVFILFVLLLWFNRWSKAGEGVTYV